jgi:predicted nucleic acid-binding protein
VLYLLDTTVLIDYLRGAPGSERLEDVVERGDVACTTAINVEEIARGVRPKDRESATTLIQGLVVIPLGADEGWRAGVWRRKFAAKGKTLSQADCLVAAAALSADAVLATGNPRDFPMKEITIEHWAVGR